MCSLMRQAITLLYERDSSVFLLLLLLLQELEHELANEFWTGASFGLLHDGTDQQLQHRDLTGSVLFYDFRMCFVRTSGSVTISMSGVPARL